MSAQRRSRTASMMTGTYAELKVKWQLWCEEEGVDDPPNLILVDSVKRARHSVIPIIEQSQEEYVKLSSGDNRAEELQRDSTTAILVQFENVEPFALKGVQVRGSFTQQVHIVFKNLNRTRLGWLLSQRVLEMLEIHGNHDSFCVLGKLVSAPLSCAVGRIIEFYSSLMTLKLIKCSLVAESMHMLGYLLQNSSISHLYLDENVVPYQNYYLILENNSKLLHLSLRLNMINDCGAEYLGRSLQYKHPHHQILRSLNLNCNLIDDDGACALAKALRWNRNLTCLALAGNRIGDRGGIALARVFLPFQLNQEELEFRAELLCDRLLQVKTVMEESGRNTKKATSKEHVDEKGQPPEYPGESGDLNEVMLYYYNLEKWAEDKVPLVTNPIVSDVSETEGGNYMSKGNDALWYLNLSYNLITEEALLVFLEAFKHQESSIAEFDRKLWRFIYEGNPYDSDHPVIEELEIYLSPYKSKISVQGEGSRKGSKTSLKSRKSYMEKKAS